MLQSLAPCSLANCGESRVKVALLAEGLKNAVPENTEILVIFLAKETAEILAKHPSLTLRTDFSEDLKASLYGNYSFSRFVYSRSRNVIFLLQYKHRH